MNWSKYLLSSLVVTTLTLSGNEGARSQIPLDKIPSLEQPSTEETEEQAPSSPLPNQRQPVPIPRDTPTRERISDPYLLGPGDTIQINVFEEPQFSGENGRQEILVDGSITLPLIGAIEVEGLTLEQTANLLTQELSSLLKFPIVTVRLVDARPLRVTVVGEVERPGSYAVSPEEAGSVVQGQVLGARTLGPPVLTEAIRLAGGITESAQVREIQILRQQRNNQTRTINVDLWELLQSGDSSQDITLRNGDRIVVPRASNLTANEVTQLSQASFSPENITVNVVGEVESPGRVQVAPNTPLNQAILAAGGFDTQRADETEITLVRLNDNGTVTEREIPIDFTEGINEENNPVLREDDIVVVERSTLTRTSENISNVARPFSGILNIIQFFRSIF
jgi:polysaccharide export outer membrane protein